MLEQTSALQEAASEGSLIAMISAVVGLLSGWIGAYLKVKGENLATKEDFLETVRQLKENTRTVEEVKEFFEKRSSLASELRNAVRQFAIAAGGLIHSVCWLTWDCSARRKINFELSHSYDDEAHKFLPEIVAQLALIAMLNREAHTKLAPLAEEIFRLDVDVANAVVRGETNLEQALKELQELLSRGSDLEKRFRYQVTNLMANDSY
jgi:hypothetical protein